VTLPIEPLPVCTRNYLVCPVEGTPAQVPPPAVPWFEGCRANEVRLPIEPLPVCTRNYLVCPDEGTPAQVPPPAVPWFEGCRPHPDCTPAAPRRHPGGTPTGVVVYA
jgi:hypothetical protein